MASTSPTPEPDNPTFSVPIIACLTVHTKSGTGNKKTTKKDTKTKEFTHSFSASKSNYIELLNIILMKHHVASKLQVTERRRYNCKIQVPPAKSVVYPLILSSAEN
jgi:hypothetical protein